MGLTRRLLLALFPKKWREPYGDEFVALLEDTDFSVRSVIDVVIQAGKLHLRVHKRFVQIAGALVVSLFFEIISFRTGLTANILWAPTNAVRALALIATVCPWLLLAEATLRQRHRRSNHLGPQTSQD